MIKTNFILYNWVRFNKLQSLHIVGDKLIHHWKGIVNLIDAWPFFTQVTVNNILNNIRKYSGGAIGLIKKIIY